MDGVLRQRLLKQQCVDYKGEKCCMCGYNNYNGALDFHHTDPTKKDFAISKVKTTRFNDRIKLELDKCILVCKNCHAEIHGDRLNSPEESNLSPPPH